MSVFDVPDEVMARAIILTPEGESTEDRWERETPYLADLIREYCEVEGAVVLDYGCGIGRLSKEVLKEPAARTVVGLDSSESMRRLATEYVGSGHFFPAHPATVVPSGAFDTALAVWVLQHVEDPVLEVARIRAHLKPGGRLFVVNNLTRAVPTAGGWADDGFDLQLLLRACFRPVGFGLLDDPAVAPALRGTTFWGVYERV